MRVTISEKYFYLHGWEECKSFYFKLTLRSGTDIIKQVFYSYGGQVVSTHVFVVSEWLPKVGHEQELWQCFKALLALTLEKEHGCIRAHVTRQISHPGSPTQSKYSIVLLQEYCDIAAFDTHCAADYVTNFFKTYIENKDTAIVEDWSCRLFSEDE